MNRAELKSRAKELIRGNKWYLWKPLIIIGLVIAVVEGIAFGLDYALGLAKVEEVTVNGLSYTTFNGGIISGIVGIFTGIVSFALAVAHAHYVLAFIRGQRIELKGVIDYMKQHWLLAFCVSLVVGLIIIGCSILLVIPGIIAAIGLHYYKEVCADNPEAKTMDIVKRAWAITKGHKMELFVLGLSFIGWAFVAGLTFGILYIWLIPYISVTYALFYEEIKNS